MREIKRQLFHYGKWLILAVLAIVIGCQPVGGLNLNKALLNGMNTTSLQQSTAITLEITEDPNNPPDESVKQVIALLNGLKLEIPEIKMERPERISMKGQLVLPLGNVPFHIFMTTEQIVFQMEGLTKTVVFPLGMPEADESDAFGQLMVKLYEEYMAKYQEKGIDKTMSELIVNNLPNPKNIKVSQGSDTVRGFIVDGYKVQATISLNEALPLLKQYLRNLAADEETLKLLIGQMYDLFWPVLEPYWKDGSLKQTLGLGSESGDIENALFDSIFESLSDRELAIDMIHTTLKELMYIGMIGIDTMDKSNDNPLKAVLNDKSYVSAKLLFDHNLKIRKADYVISVTPQFEMNQGIQNVKVTIQEEYWDHNRTFKADELKPGNDAFVLDENASPFEMMGLIDPNSVLVQFINELQSAMPAPQLPDTADSPAEFAIPVGDKDADSPLMGYIDNGVGYAPLWLLSSQMGAYVEYDGDHVTIEDEWGTVIEVTVGSADAVIDGEPVVLDGAVHQKGEFVYVPVRAIVEALGATVTYDEEYSAFIVEMYGF